MRGKNFIAMWGLLVSVAFLWSLPSAGDAGAPKIREVTCSPQKTIGDEIRKLDPGDTLLVSGVCSENVVIPEEVHRITLDGQGTATINGPDATRASVQVRGRGITVKNFTITVTAAHSPSTPPSELPTEAASTARIPNYNFELFIS